MATALPKPSSTAAPLGSPGPAPKSFPDDADTVVGFFQVNPTFLVPYVLLGLLLQALQLCPLTQAFFAEREMVPWGFQNAAQYSVAMVIIAYGMHGMIAANHDEFVQQGMKLQEAKRYLFTHREAATRFTCIMITQFCVYWSLPIRPGRSGLWGVFDFFVGLSILNVLQDAWFFFVHWLCHQPGWYEDYHKTHHRWRTPTPFASYYISKWAHFIQEHCLTVPVMLLCPVPLSSWLYYQYIGTTGAMMQHSNFMLTTLKLPLVPVTIGDIFTLFNPWVFILGAHTTAHHDHHHENFHGNFQLTYTYLDRWFGTYIEPEKTTPELLAPLEPEPAAPAPAAAAAAAPAPAAASRQWRVEEHPELEEP